VKDIGFYGVALVTMLAILYDGQARLAWSRNLAGCCRVPQLSKSALGVRGQAQQEHHGVAAHCTRVMVF
jgi:hypothetical protein